MTEVCDIAIIGGGPVGSALALMLAHSGLRIAVLEARKPTPVAGDGRTLALSYGSRLIFDRIGAWGDALQATAIETVHVSQRGGFGRATLRASDAGVPALGYTISYNALSNVLSDRLGDTAVQYIWDAMVAYTEKSGDEVLIDAHISGAPRQLRARLAVLADGGRGLMANQRDSARPNDTHVKDYVGSTDMRVKDYADSNDMRVKDYAQCALTALVKTERPHNGCAYERFTPGGPTALLPVRDRFALVWIAPQAQSERLLGLNDAEFLVELQQHFGDRQGRFLEIGTRAAFPLSLRYARQIALPGVVRVGNAAQAVHPVAGQGFNLGLRDAWSLSRLVLEADAQALNGAALARAYARTRRLDRAVGIGLTDFLVNIFETDRPLLRAARGAGLWLLETGGPLRRAFTRAMLFGSSSR
jgi:2-octaprenyl-6-methoxyphenol hydroxylase